VRAASPSETRTAGGKGLVVRERPSSFAMRYGGQALSPVPPELLATTTQRSGERTVQDLVGGTVL